MAGGGHWWETGQERSEWDGGTRGAVTQARGGCKATRSLRGSHGLRLPNRDPVPRCREAAAADVVEKDSVNVQHGDCACREVGPPDKAPGRRGRQTQGILVAMTP